ncbi:MULTISPECIES: hypothetical protein [unclassified Brevibacillus]|uniref:hypothetical protein n=1 Tax=Brevibacillus TaxID=55080 RepID=UPI000ED33022|nr:MULTISPECIES: hypothetical protein [unclassified Brevibacillus]UED72163.1 hypothetical protein HP435_29090 [Brevibacillus sp. HD3.3A]HBZ80903.1 hypothetical protein [Brevibacillus sp.]
MMQPFVDRRYNLGDEKKYQMMHQDGTVEVVELEKIGIVEPGSRINAAALNPIVDHVNNQDLHVPRSQYNALELRVQTLENQLANDLRNNNFAFDFSSTVGLQIDAGWVDASKGWLVIKA